MFGAAKTFIPHDYQAPSIAFLQETPRCALWAPMGSGKTVMTLTALEELSVVEEVYPALFIAPKRVAISTWGPEAAKWEHTKHLRVSVVVGTAAERKAALAVPADIYVATYDTLDWLVEALPVWPFKTIVADELTRLRSFRTRQGGKRAGALGKVAFKSKRFFGLTGTPGAAGLTGLWGQTFFLDKGERLGKSFSAFEQRWFRKGFDGFKLEAFPHSQKEIEAKLGDICLTVEGLSVDEPVVRPIYVELDKKAREIYRRMEKEFFAEIEDKGVDAANAAVKSGKLLQIANGALYTDDDHNWSLVHGAKIEALESIIEEANGMPVLVSYTFQHDLARLLKSFPKGRQLDAKAATIDQWNRGEIPVLFAHPQSAGHGLNLQDGGNILARFGLGWSLEDHMQILERIGPLRQKQSGHNRPVFDFPILAKSTLDEVVMDRLASKKSVQDCLLVAMLRYKSLGAL